MSENYEKVKLLGEGAFGKAFLAKCFATRSHVVLKEINLAKMTLKDRREARREVLILSQLEHCCIVTYINSYETPKCLVIVMEYCDNGDLQHKLMSRKNDFLSEDQILSWFVQICLALKHLHDRKILHRDIKSQNIFLTKSGLVKLGDFGIAKILNNTTELALTQAGTPYYLSPEICDAKPYNNKSDIWSMGCILYELSSLKHPFSGKTIVDLLRNIKKASYAPIPSCFSADLHELVSKLLKKHPQDRPDINSILKHPIIWRKIGEYLTQKDYEKEFSHTVLHGLKMSKPSQPIDPKKLKKARKTQETPKSEIKKVDESNRGVRKNMEEHKSARDPCFQIKPKCYDEKAKAKNFLKPEIKRHQVNVEIQKIPKEPLQKANDFLKRRNEYAERLRQIRLQNLKKKFNPKDCKAKAPSKENRNRKYTHHRNKKDFDESYQRAIKEVEALGRMSSSKKTKKKALTKKTNQSSDNSARSIPRASLNERRNSAQSSLDNVRVASARVGSSKRKSLPNIKDTPRGKETARKQWNIPQGSKVSKLVAVKTEHVQEEVKELLVTGKLDVFDPLLLRTCSEPDLLNIIGLQSDEEDDSSMFENKNKLVSHKEDGFEMILPLLKSKSMSDLTSPNLKKSSGKALSNSSESSCSESNDELDSVRESMVSCLTFTPLLDFERELENIQEIPEGHKERAIKCAWEGTDFGLQKLQSTILKTIKCFTEEGHGKNEYFEKISEEPA